ncbi:MAG: hypothetical protein ACPG8I_08055, partial [Candidatus Poseidoniaceae archaeon]
MDEATAQKPLTRSTRPSFLGRKVVASVVLVMLFGAYLALDAYVWSERDVVKTNPPPASELQPGRVLSDEPVYISGEGTGNFRTRCDES